MNFTVDKPLKGHDEDAPAYADEKMLIVCDGLGGGGQNAYLVDGVKRTSAYLGSRKISAACQEYLSTHYDEFCSNMQDPASLIAGLKTYIFDALDYYVTEKGLKNIVRGRSMQMLPSTLAAIVYKHYEDHTDALVISAGDSRAFVLTPENGLQQISKDDVFENVDAFEKSATMTNNIRQDGDFHINYGYFSLPANCILLVCTDGCFDYISTPMELEFRLEYSISKCGDLFDPDRDNLGQYFGDVLVNSGLKDDCTMAGVILGYSDTETTKNLFLKRALYIQEKYRNPCAACDKESAKRRAETSTQFPELEAKMSTLRTQIDAEWKSGMMTAFQYDLDGATAQKPEGICQLSEALKTFESYTNLFVELEKHDREKALEAEAKKAELAKEKDRLKRIFKAMRFEDFVANLVSFNPMNIFNAERSRFAGEYRRLQSALNKSKKEYIEALDGFEQAFEELKMTEPKKLKTMNDFLKVSDRYEALQQAFMGYIDYKQELLQCRESLETFYMENDDTVEQEFVQAWQRRFSAYSSRPQHRELRAGHDRCTMLQTEIDGCVPFTREQKIEKFKALMESNLSAYMGLLKNDPTLCQLICGTMLAELSALEKQYEELKKYASEFDDKKYAMWLEYKPVYELFGHGLGGIV